jgi:hypothetical protein
MLGYHHQNNTDMPVGTVTPAEKTSGNVSAMPVKTEFIFFKQTIILS